MGTIINKPWGYEEFLIGDPSTTTGQVTKLIHTHQNLSIQMHTAKTEVFVGVNKLGSHTKLDDLLGKYYYPPYYADALDFLNKLLNNPSEALAKMINMYIGNLCNYRLVPGCIHFICAGVELIEVSEGTQETVKLFDWNRNDPTRSLDFDTAREFYRTTLLK